MYEGKPVHHPTHVGGGTRYLDSQTDSQSTIPGCSPGYSSLHLVP